MTRFAVALCLATLALGADAGEAGSAGPAFEVASIKPSQPRRDGQMSVSTGLAPAIKDDRTIITYQDVTLEGLLATAYDILPAHMSGPSWLRDRFFVVRAKMPAGAHREQIPAMLQRLLAERFHVRVHWETKQAAGYELIVGKTGPKLTPAKEPADKTRPALRFSWSGNGDVRIEWTATTLDRLAQSLAVDLKRPVVNATHVEGLYNIVLECAGDSLPGLQSMPRQSDSTPVAPPLPLAPPVFVAIRKLGLELAPRTLPDRRLIVDAADATPTEN
jgi:uncharacterized protein (TIGR03435 family)